jgi:hypothetical protein
MPEKRKKQNNKRSDEAIINESEYPRKFKILGKDEEHRYWFLPAGDAMPFGIMPSGFNISSYLVLDPNLQYWLDFTNFIVKKDDQGETKRIERDHIMSYLMKRCEKKSFDLAALRGPGFWIDDGKKVYNNGSELYVDKKKYTYKEFKTEHVYIRHSSKRPNIINGDLKESTDAEGQLLLDLIKLQNIDNELNELMLFGWAMIAPFGSLLDWRPHIWITTAPGQGKTFLLFDIIGKLLCSDNDNIGFAYCSEGATTAAGMKRKIGKMGMCAILDEFEMNKSKKDNIENIIDQVHSAASAKNGKYELTGKNGKVETYMIRQPFLLGSVNTPQLQTAKSDRISIIELSHKESRNKEKVKNTKEILKTGLIEDNPGKFTKRINDNWPLFLENSAKVKDALFETDELTPREIDRYISLLAAAYTALQKNIISDEEINRITKMIIKNKKGIIKRKDEDVFFELLLQKSIDVLKSGKNVKSTIGNLLTVSETVINVNNNNFNEAYPAYIHDALGMVGIKIAGYINNNNGDINSEGYLFIHTNSADIKKIMSDEEIFAGGYSSIMKRHEAYIVPEKKQHKIHIGGTTKDCLKFDLNKIVDLYFSGDNEFLNEVEDIEPEVENEYNDDEELPF